MAISFAWFLALYYFVLDGVFPQDADKKVRQRLRYQGKKLVICDDGRLAERVSGREVLHEGNALEKVKAIHQEGHQGILNTLDKVVKFYFLQDARDMVTAVVKGCETCQFRARIKAIRSNPSTLIKTPRHPFFTVSVDAIGPLSVTDKKNRYILTGICHLTRYPVARAVPDIDEVTTGEFYMQEIVKNFGVPFYLLSDRGQNFISYYSHYLLKQLGCKGIMTTAYRPQANGLCERFNGSLTSVLAKLARDVPKILGPVMNPPIYSLVTK